jgi:hypothetical protein
MSAIKTPNPHPPYFIKAFSAELRVGSFFDPGLEVVGAKSSFSKTVVAK